MSMAEQAEKSRLFAGLIYGESADSDDDSPSTEELLKSEFDVLDRLGKWKHVCALAGLALYQAQLFEANLFNILLYHARILRTVATEDEYDALVADLTGKTLGTLLEKVRKVLSISDDDIRLLKEALRLRNQLCHGLFLNKANDLLTEAGMRRISAELVETQKTLENAEFVSLLICKLLLKVVGIDENDLLAEAERERYAARLREGEI